MFIRVVACGRHVVVMSTPDLYPVRFLVRQGGLFQFRDPGWHRLVASSGNKKTKRQREARARAGLACNSAGIGSIRASGIARLLLLQTYVSEVGSLHR